MMLSHIDLELAGTVNRVLAWIAWALLAYHVIRSEWRKHKDV
jgi:hypothetical protein